MMRFFRRWKVRPNGRHAPYRFKETRTLPRFNCSSPPLTSPYRQAPTDAANTHRPRAHFWSQTLASEEICGFRSQASSDTEPSLASDLVPLVLTKETLEFRCSPRGWQG